MKRRISMLVAAAGLVALAFPTMANAASSPSVRVGPHDNLTNGETVTVRWKGFHAHAERFITIYECRPDFDTVGWIACSQLYGDTTRGRREQRTIQVSTGVIGLDDGTCGTSATDRDCLIMVRASRLRASGGSIASTPIKFAVPQ
ncbi:MAG TPA: hypothetical protein VH914_04845 [Acidimicrobiia bacterium]|nr:hypothetical protein [Acidimicrobiia bacterium]